jgi:hypothetical protein
MRAMMRVLGQLALGRQRFHLFGSEAVAGTHGRVSGN